MNLVKAAELLKSAPEDTLKKYLANPNGEFPEYLVASEIARRDDMRKRYSAELQGQPPKTSIIEELLQRDNAALRAPEQPQVPPEAMGLGAVPPPPGMQLSAAPIMQAAQQEPPQQFYDGGVVALAGGGDVMDAFNEYMRPAVQKFAAGNLVNYQPDLSAFDINPELMRPQEVTEVQELPFYQKQMADLVGPSATEGYKETLSKDKERIAANRKNYLSDFLIRAGIGAMGSTGNTFQAISQGLAQGFESYQKSKEQDDEAERNLSQSEFKFKQAQRAENMGLLGLSRQAMSDAMADRRAGYDAARSAEALRLQAATGKNAAMNQAAQLGISEKELAMRAREIAAAAQRHKESMAMEEKRIKAQIERDNAITPTVRTQAANVVSDAITRYRKQLEDGLASPEWYTEATEKIKSLANNPIAQQVEMQRLENQIRMKSGLSTDILKIAGFN